MNLPNPVIGNNVSRTGVCEGNPHKSSCHFTEGKKWRMHEEVKCFFYSFTFAQLDHPGLKPEISCLWSKSYSPTIGKESIHFGERFIFPKHGQVIRSVSSSIRKLTKSTIKMLSFSNCHIVTSKKNFFDFLAKTKSSFHEHTKNTILNQKEENNKRNMNNIVMRIQRSTFPFSYHSFQLLGQHPRQTRIKKN